MTAELRSAPAPSLGSRRSPEGGTEGTPTLFGRFAVFNQWAEIDSVFEGRFMERIAPGAFARTLAHDRQRLRVLFQHGRDPQIGDKVLGIPTLLREDELGARYEVPLLTPAMSATCSLLSVRAPTAHRSASKSSAKTFDKAPVASVYNPNALPERTIREAQLLEFGPVTFPPTRVQQPASAH
jgi:phage head maturation protease